MATTKPTPEQIARWRREFAAASERAKEKIAQRTARAAALGVSRFSREANK